MSATVNAQPVVVRRYAQSRFYDATNWAYVTVEQLGSWLVRGVAFSVTDAETGENIKDVLLA